MLIHRNNYTKMDPRQMNLKLVEIIIGKRQNNARCLQSYINKLRDQMRGYCLQDLSVQSICQSRQELEKLFRHISGVNDIQIQKKMRTYLKQKLKDYEKIIQSNINDAFLKVKSQKIKALGQLLDLIYMIISKIDQKESYIQHWQDHKKMFSNLHSKYHHPTKNLIQLIRQQIILLIKKLKAQYNYQIKCLDQSYVPHFNNSTPKMQKRLKKNQDRFMEQGFASYKQIHLNFNGSIAVQEQQINRNINFLPENHRPRYKKRFNNLKHDICRQVKSLLTEVVELPFQRYEKYLNWWSQNKSFNEEIHKDIFDYYWKLIKKRNAQIIAQNNENQPQLLSIFRFLVFLSEKAQSNPLGHEINQMEKECSKKLIKSLQDDLLMINCDLSNEKSPQDFEISSRQRLTFFKEISRLGYYLPIDFLKQYQDKFNRAIQKANQQYNFFKKQLQGFIKGLNLSETSIEIIEKKDKDIIRSKNYHRKFEILQHEITQLNKEHKKVQRQLDSQQKQRYHKQLGIFLQIKEQAKISFVEPQKQLQKLIDNISISAIPEKVPQIHLLETRLSQNTKLLNNIRAKSIMSFIKDHISQKIQKKIKNSFDSFKALVKDKYKKCMKYIQKGMQNKNIKTFQLFLNKLAHIGFYLQKQKDIDKMSNNLEKSFQHQKYKNDKKQQNQKRKSNQKQLLAQQQQIQQMKMGLYQTLEEMQKMKKKLDQVCKQNYDLTKQVQLQRTNNRELQCQLMDASDESTYSSRQNSRIQEMQQDVKQKIEDQKQSFFIGVQQDVRNNEQNQNLQAQNIHTKGGIQQAGINQHELDDESQEPSTLPTVFHPQPSTNQNQQQQLQSHIQDQAKYKIKHNSFQPKQYKQATVKFQCRNDRRIRQIYFRALKQILKHLQKKRNLKRIALVYEVEDTNDQKCSIKEQKGDYLFSNYRENNYQINEQTRITRIQSDQKIESFIKSIAQAISQLHKLGIYHADLYLRNVIRFNWGNQYIYKLIDFDKAFLVFEGKETRNIFKYWLQIQSSDYSDQIIDFILGLPSSQQANNSDNKITIEKLKEKKILQKKERLRQKEGIKSKRKMSIIKRSKMCIDNQIDACMKELAIYMLKDHFWHFENMIYKVFSHPMNHLSKQYVKIVRKGLKKLKNSVKQQAYKMKKTTNWRSQKQKHSLLYLDFIQYINSSQG